MNQLGRMLIKFYCYINQMMAWLEQERLEGERELGEGDTYVVYQVETPASPGRHLPSWWSIRW